VAALRIIELPPKWITQGEKLPEKLRLAQASPLFAQIQHLCYWTLWRVAARYNRLRPIYFLFRPFSVRGVSKLTSNGQPSKPRVLVVDDERVIADTLAIILNQNGFDASAVYTGTAAVDRARETRPDLIISDVIMPDMNGIEAAIRIRKALPGCKILLFSGQAATADLLEKARAQGHEFEILAKPVHPQDLLAKLRN
jgi:CheY-like chemotaxis protein